MGGKKRVRFIHTADLHLGSALKSVGQTSGRIAEILKKATFTAMERICDVALREAVDFLVIAGDLYDREARSVKAGFFLQEQFKRLAEKNIPVLIIAGNHDPLGEGGSLVTFPGNVRVFGGDETQCFKIHDESRARGGEVIARVFGRSYKTRYEKQKVFETYRPQDREVWNIGLLHTALEPESNYLPSSAGELAKVEGIDYWALGHAHTGQIVRREPDIVYPGIPQGRAPDEQGIGGCVLVDLLPQEEARIQFIPVSPVVWRVEEVWLDSSSEAPPENLDDLLEIFERKAEGIINGQALERIPEPGLEQTLESSFQSRKVEEDLVEAGQGVKGYIVRWVLKGRGEIHRYLSAQGEEAEEAALTALRRRFGPEHGQEGTFLWSESIRFSTGLPLPDLAELRKSDETFNELDLVIKELRTEAGYKAAAQRLGGVWEEVRGGEGEGEEEQNPEKIQFRKTGGLNSLDLLIEEAKELVIEKIMERRTER